MISKYEERITLELKWKTISDIPNFPINSFNEIQNKINFNEYSLGIDFSTSNQFAQWFYGTDHKYLFLALASAPLFFAIISIILSFVYGNYWLLFGVALGLFFLLFHLREGGVVDELGNTSKMLFFILFGDNLQMSHQTK